MRVGYLLSAVGCLVPALCCLLSAAGDRWSAVWKSYITNLLRVRSSSSACLVSVWCLCLLQSSVRHHNLACPGHHKSITLLSCSRTTDANIGRAVTLLHASAHVLGVVRVECLSHLQEIRMGGARRHLREWWSSRSLLRECAGEEHLARLYMQVYVCVCVCVCICVYV
jgi:hypothetical protein